MLAQTFAMVRGLASMLVLLALLFMVWLFMAMRAATLVQAAVARSRHGSP